MNKPLRKDDQSAKRNGGVPADEQDREHDRFEDLVRRLVQVPKSAVDKARKAAKH